MKRKNTYIFHSQLALPFLETNENHLGSIFQTLEDDFGLKKDSNQKLIDLGAGNGGVIIFSALNYRIKSCGIEINANLIQEAKERMKTLKQEKKQVRSLLKKAKIKFGDIFEQNLHEFDFVYIYSLPTMHRYLNHVFKTAKFGTIIISYKHELKGFNSYLKVVEKLDLETNNSQISAYFYRKF